MEKDSEEYNEFMEQHYNECDKKEKEITQHVEPKSAPKSVETVIESEDDASPTPKTKPKSNVEIEYDKRLAENNNFKKNGDKEKSVDEEIKFVEVKQHAEDITKIKDDILQLHKDIEEKNELIELLAIANIDFINIDLSLLSDDLHDAETRLLSIGTSDQFTKIRDIEKNVGLNMAYQETKIYLEESGSTAKLIIPILNNIKITLGKISEKLKYSAEA